MQQIGLGLALVLILLTLCVPAWLVAELNSQLAMPAKDITPEQLLLD